MTPKQLGDKLAQARQDAHLDLFIVAHKLGVHFTQIRVWENPDSEIDAPNDFMVARLYDLYGVKTGVFADSDDNGAIHTLPQLKTPQIAYRLNRNQQRYLRFLHQGRRGFGRIMQAHEYIELQRLDLVHNEALTAHGEWYVESLEVT